MIATMLRDAHVLGGDRVMREGEFGHVVKAGCEYIEMVVLAQDPGIMTERVTVPREAVDITYDPFGGGFDD